MAFFRIRNIKRNNDFLTFSSLTTDGWALYTDNGLFCDGTLEYSLDKIHWTEWDGNEVYANSKKEIYLRGTGNTTFYGSEYTHIKFGGQYMKVSGNIETLLDYQTVGRKQHPTMAASCFKELFRGSTIQYITELQLPATTLTDDCYANMFYGCNKITSIPSNLLPATTLARACYNSMFRGCTGLTSIPVGLLPATILTPYCYANMFYGCSGLYTINLGFMLATKMSEYSCSSMFYGCSSINELPSNLLPSTELANYCYESMFYGCSGFQSIPSGFLPATTLKNGCYRNMFNRCFSLKDLPSDLLPAINLNDMCYMFMFNTCINLKVSSTQTGNYTKPFRIPYQGIGRDTYRTGTQDMFSTTGGTFTGTPSINTTYYLDIT